MGLDIKAAADAAGNAVQNLPGVQDISAKLPALPGLDALRPFAGLFFLVVAGILIGFAGRHTAIGRRASRGLEETIFTNWRLALLGATGFVLSLASGYTTWDGMRAFTGEAVLSGMVTFGIQGVMLIVAWLIGESFASGMSHRPAAAAPRAGFSRGAQAGLGAVIGTLLFVTLMIVVLQSTGQVDVRSASATDLGWSKFGDKLMIIGVGLLLAALVALYSASDLVVPYIQSFRIIVKNAVLWIMFLSCMATSVFFSFNSLFSVIFPQDQRVRAAELRAQNQVAGIIADIGTVIGQKRLSEAEDLFNSEGWRTYDQSLSALSQAAQGASGEIEKYFNDKLEERNRAVKQQQERIVTAQSGQAGLASKKVSLTDELSRLEGERPGLAAEYAEKKSALDARAKEVDAKRVEAMAEDKGVEGSGKVGRGPMYRQRMDELNKLQDYYKIGEERVKDAQKRLGVVETRISQIKRELAALDGDLAKYKGEAETAEQRIKLTQEQLPSDNNARVDPARMLPAFEGLRAEFRQDPNAERLAKLQQTCGQIYTAMATSTPETKKKVAGVDCDPKQAAEAAQVVFALNDGAVAFKQGCEGGDKLNAQHGADALFGFARKCLADSGLPSKETDALRTKINTIELNRDDKAHPLVATVNAFIDGNRLAYLALFIALSMDLLIFMSGLFGANAVRSPLSDVPSLKPRTGQQLEAIIENALLPDKFENARAVLNAMRPMTPKDGYTQRVFLDEADPHAPDVHRVLNAAASIGAVRQAETGEYHVRSELFEFLSVVAKKAFESDKRHVNMAELEKIIGVSLLPDVGGNAQIVLDHMHPITEDRGFTAQVHLDEIEPEHKRVVRSALNAGATLLVVQRVGTDSASYFIHGDFYKAVARIRARSMGGGWGQPRIAGPAGGNPRTAQWGGALTGGQAALPSSSVPNVPSLTHQPQYDNERGDDPTQPPRKPPNMATATPQGHPQPSFEPEPVAPPLRDSFVESLVKAIGIDYEQYIRIPHSAYGSAVAASEAFARSRRTNALLDDALAMRDDEARSAFIQAKSFMQQRLDPEDNWAFDSACKEVEDNLPVLMMLPGAPYEQVLQMLISSLEEANGEGALKPQDAALYASAVNLRDCLAGGPRSTDQGWRQIEHALIQRARNASANPNVAGVNGGRRLNS